MSRTTDPLLNAYRARGSAAILRAHAKIRKRWENTRADYLWIQARQGKMTRRNLRANSNPNAEKLEIEILERPQDPPDGFIWMAGRYGDVTLVKKTGR